MVPKQPLPAMKPYLHTKDLQSKTQPKHHQPYPHHRQQQLQQRRQNHIYRQQAAFLHSIATVYAGSFGQAAALQKLFDVADGRILAEESIARIARRICKTWEPQQQAPSYVSGFVKFIKFILSHTNQPVEPFKLDSALRICHHRRSAFPTVHPPLVLLLALGYLERLSLRYHDTKGEPGCAQRLFLMSYSIAAKYLHSNLAFISTPYSLVGRSGMGFSEPQIHRSPHSRSSSLSSPPQSPIKSTISRSTTTEPEPIPVGSGRASAVALSPSLMTMTASTDFLSRVIPNVSTRELYRMEIELLSFLDYDLAVYSLAEVERWRDLYVMEDFDIKVKREEEEEDEEMETQDQGYSIVKTEQEDEGIGHYEPEDGGHAEDALARGNLLM